MGRLEPPTYLLEELQRCQHKRVFEKEKPWLMDVNGNICIFGTKLFPTPTRPF